MKKATLLLVDDTPSNIRVLNGILQDDYRIVVATNGPDALSLAAVAEKLEAASSI